MQELEAVEIGTVIATKATNVDLKNVCRINKVAFLQIHGTTTEELYANGTPHFQTSIHPSGHTYVPFFIQAGISSRVQLALIDTDGNISLIGDKVGVGETFLCYTQFVI